MKNLGINNYLSIPIYIYIAYFAAKLCSFLKNPDNQHKYKSCIWLDKHPIVENISTRKYFILYDFDVKNDLFLKKICKFKYTFIQIVPLPIIFIEVENEEELNSLLDDQLSYRIYKVNHV